jgi:hypothetical protein
VKQPYTEVTVRDLQTGTVMVIKHPGREMKHSWPPAMTRNGVAQRPLSGKSGPGPGG